MSSSNESSNGNIITRTQSLPRTNGWACPWHPLQVIAWLFFMFLALSHYGFLVYYFPGYWRVLGYVVPGLLLIMALFFVAMATTIDPSDRHLRHKRMIGIFKRGKFDRNQHEHVIEDFHCHICDTDVTSKAKHCRICDKCVEGFDHHCKWLNTCVGSRNYKWFIAAIVSSLIGAIMATLLSSIFFILFFSSREHVKYFCDNVYNISSCDSTVRIFGAAVPDPVFPVLTVLLAVLSAIVVVLLGHLTLFHCYLICKGISTYDYITLQREAISDDDSASGCLKRKANRISPLEDVDKDSSTGSAGLDNFNRTPPESKKEEEGILHDNGDLSQLSASHEAANKVETKPQLLEPDLAIIEVETMLGSLALQGQSIDNEPNLSLHCNSLDRHVNDSHSSESQSNVLKDSSNPSAAGDIEQVDILNHQQLLCKEEDSIILPVEHSPSPEPIPLTAVSRKVTFEEVNSTCDDTRFTVPSPLPPVVGKDGRPMATSATPPPCIDQPHCLISSSSTRRPLPPLKIGDSSVKSSYESLTSSHSSLSLSSDPRYQRRSFHKSPAISLSTIESPAVSRELKMSKFKNRTQSNERLGQSQPFDPQIAYMK